MSMEFSFGGGPKICLWATVKNGGLKNTVLEPADVFTLKINEACERLVTWCAAYARKEAAVSPLILDLSQASPFQKEVLKWIQSIPFGQSSTYGEGAQTVGCDRGARAVGAACGSNPFPLLIPCHRVLAADRSLRGFSQGVRLKKELLEFEGAAFNHS